MKRLTLALFALCVAPACFAQTGYPVYGSFQSSPVDAVNLQNLNTVVSIPVIQTAGRGGTSFGFSIYNNSLEWVPSGGSWQPTATGGWAPSPLLGSVSNTFTVTQGTCGRCTGDTCQGYTTESFWGGYVYVDPVGAPHSFGTTVWVRDTYSSCTGRDLIQGTYTGYSTDNLYYINIGTSGSDPSTPIVTAAKPGIKMSMGGGLTDTNGNEISKVYVNGNEYDWKDSAGRTAMRQIQNGSNVEYHYYDTTGTDRKFVLVYQNYSVMTNFGCSGLLEYNSSGSLPQWSLPSELDLPNGQKYLFSYEATPSHSTYITGRLAKITVPTGGTYSYSYGGSNDGVSCSNGNVTNLTRTVSDGTNSAPWTFVSTGSTTTVTTPQLSDTSQPNDTVLTFNSLGQETSRKIYPNSPGTGTPLRTINTTWASNGSPATQVTILDDGTTQSEVDTTIDQYGLLDTVSEYDFGSGARGPLIRTTNLTYNTSTNYTNLNIRDLLISKQITNSAGTVLYRQDTTYDGTAPTNCPTGVAQHDDTDYPCTFNYRGNPTSVTTYLTPSGPSGPVTKNFTYDFFGNLLTAQVNCCQNKTWVYSSTTNYSEPDSVTSGTSPGPTLTTSATYNSYTGQVVTATDANNLVTNFTYDLSLRPTQVYQTIGSTNGESVSYSYNDTAFTATTTTSIDSSKSVQQITAADTLGRPYLSTTEDAGNNVYSNVTAAYDLAGRAYKASNPYTSSASYWTVTQFDALGRPISVTQPAPDSSVTSYSYTTNTSTVTDPAGVKRESITDGSGRLSSIYEPDPTNNNTLSLQTSYTYNVLDELTQVSQGSQTRTYAYDALGRLNSATTPEGGTVCLGTYSGSTCQSNGYDSFNNLLYRTDARGVVTNYIYDSLNRLLGITYPTVPNGVGTMPNVCETTGSSSNNANVCFTYGTSAASYNNGRVSAMNDGVGSESYTYNSLGQMTQLQKVISSTTYTMGYQYNVANQLTQITYPSSRVVQQYVDPIGRVCAIATSTTSCSAFTGPFATGFGYSTASQVTGFKYGNNVYASFGFSSDRLQLNCLDYSTTNRSGTCTHDGTSKFGLTYSYGSAGSNNGQISSITDYMDSGRTITYTYDSLYRMTKAVTTGSTNYPAWGLSEAYDRYGNRSAQSIYSGCTGITCPTNSVTVSAATNQITGSPYLYDASGNMKNDGVNTLTYDGEGRAVAASGSLGSGTYTVDGNGLRVKKVAGSTTTVYIFSGSKVIAEYQNGAAPSAPTTEYIYAGGTLIAKINSSGTNYYHQDHLSNRYVTNSSGGKVAEMGHFPFGESWYNASNDKLYFTTYEYDSESGNHYAMARYHVSRLGRLSSPDPLAGSIADPQSLNRYAYSVNDPANVIDPSGAFPWGCETGQAEPKGESQQTSSAGHSDEASDADADPPPQQTGCRRYSDGLGSDGGVSDGGISLDGTDVTDTSGALNMGFGVGGGFGGKVAVFASAGEWQEYNFVGWDYFVPGFSMSGSGGDEDDSIGRVKKLLERILGGKNKCSDLFNSSPFVISYPPISLTPADYVSLTTVGTYPGSGNGQTVGQTGSSPTGTILFDDKGPFFTSGSVNGGYLNPKITLFPNLGPFQAGSLGYQAVALFHEEGHNLQVPSIVDDGSDPSGFLSASNTQLILKNCTAAIEQAILASTSFIVPFL